MNKFVTMKPAFFIIALTALFANTLSAQETVPSVKIETLDGESVDFRSLVDTGKITVISFWATWCGPCIKELQAIDAHYEEWSKKYNMELIAVSIDDARNVKKVKPKVLGEGWAYTIAIDQNQELARAMNVNNPPMTFIVDRKGKIVYTHQGYTPGAEDELEEQMIQLSEN